MADHPVGSDPPAVHDAAQQRRNPVHLAQGKGAVAGVGDLDPDGAGIHVVPAFPGVRRAAGTRQARAGAGGIGHARVMQHDQFGALAAPVAMVGAGETSAHSGGWPLVRMEGGTITTGALGLCTGAAGAIAGLTTRTRSTPMVAGIGTGLRPAISAPVGA